MRKILTSVLSVAGLLAVVLALASSPASAAKQVITITSADTVGTYTVSWETQGGCDPGSGTSGASGSVTLTVTAPTPGATTGTAAVTGVVTDNICNYTWSASLVDSTGAHCRIAGAADGTALATPDDGAMSLALVDDGCATMGKLAVTVKAPGVNVGDCIEAPDDDGAFDDEDCETANANDPNDGSHDLAVAADVTDARSVGAASGTTFTITATPQKAANGKVPEGCVAVSGDTETDFDDNNLQKATLTVVDRAFGGGLCMYTVTAALPPGFAAGDGSARSTANSQKNQDPDADSTGPDGIAGTGCGTATAANCDDDGTEVVPDLTVSVTSVKVYLVQNVIGDAGGANAEYKYTAPCGAPGLPGALKRVPASGGISTVEGKTVVELRTGRFNVSEALGSGATAADGTEAHALDAKGKACEATVSVTGAPASCSVSSNSPASLAVDGDSVIIEVTVDCSPPPAPEPPAEEPMDDMGGDDMGADDMGADDMGADDMGADDMGSDDMGDMGPPEDVATG